MLSPVSTTVRQIRRAATVTRSSV
ncbi:hypothetical protein KGM_209525 [Danaus plexippus plexippus]|uniref:Uncharacterized protein n=1 Tax=Danaus plexippus plexippus TaxID=278856 RepID=A0A212FJG3_DANPL|nr:hypothetical protein KGM_209525 [Danaus plexippus plexippus]